MKSLARERALRRRLLRQAVEENYRTMHGIPAPSESRRRRRQRIVRAFALSIGLMVLAGASYVLATAYLRPQDPAPAGERTVLLVPPPAARPNSPPRESAVGDGDSAALGRGVLPFSVRRVVLDPGHGGIHRGTASATGLQEKEITLDIALRLRELLEKQGFEVFLTREEDRELSLEARGDRANEVGADIFVSIHINWFVENDVRAVETFYLGPTDDEDLQRHAARENLGTELALRDFREALERVYVGVRRSESRELAQAIQRELLKSLRTINPWVENRGVKSAPFGVLIRTEMPAVLAEIGCLSNAEEAKLLERSDYRQFLAEALMEGVRSYALNLNPNLTLGS